MLSDLFGIVLVIWGFACGGWTAQFTEWCNEMVISCEQSGVTATVDLLKLGMFGMRGEPNAVQGAHTHAFAHTRTLSKITYKNLGAQCMVPEFLTF